jgi:hypothetical protein
LIVVLNTPHSPLAELILGDPVRPHIPIETRFTNGEVWMLCNEQDDVAAVLCVSWQDFVPESESELFQCSGVSPSVAVFYTVWSLSPGAGQKMIQEAQKRLKHAYPHIQRAVTLSPPTAMARKFHLRNGAFELQVNSTTVNFEYALS